MDVEKMQALIGKEIVSCVPLEQGISNEVYLINHQYVLRIKCQRDSFYHPRIERRIDQLAFSHGLNAHTLWLKDDGHRLSEYIPETRFLDIQKKEDIVLVARSLAALHHISCPLKTKFSPLLRLSFYQKSVNARIIGEEIIIKNYRRHKKTYTLCHNDMVRGNMLFTNDKLYLIDYEYAALNDPYFDLASFISENNITDASLIDLFISTYNSQVPFNMQKFNDFLRFLDLLWYYWALYNYQSQHQLIFLHIAKEKEKRLQL